jgi:hypothetical protein
MIIPTIRQLADFYGKPGPAMETHLVVVETPWKTTYAGKPTRGFRVHEKIADDLRQIFDEIWNDVAHKSQATCDHMGVSVSSGGYYHRRVRGGSSFSLHAYGAAIDMDAGRNPMGERDCHFRRHPLVVNAFLRHKWSWGGLFSRPDGMHFEAVDRGQKLIQVPIFS